MSIVLFSPLEKFFKKKKKPLRRRLLPIITRAIRRRSFVGASICWKARISRNWMFRLLESSSRLICNLLRKRLRLSPWYHTSVYNISRIRINCCDYDRWSRSYFAIFLSGARPRRDAANYSQRYLWPSYAHFVASRHFRHLELNRYAKKHQWLSYLSILFVYLK